MLFDDLSLEAVPVGRDLLLLITGGVAHIGAASTAYTEGGNVSVQTSAVPGHKEHVLTVELARMAAAALDKTVTVVMGIHYDGLTKQEIEIISERTFDLLNSYLLSQSGTTNGGE